MDFNQFIENENKEYRKKQLESLKTSDGRKKFVQDKIGMFVNRCLKNKNYQFCLGIILIYILLSGLYIVFRDIFSIKTLFIILVCIAFIYREKIYYILSEVKYSLFRFKQEFQYYFNTTKNRISGIFKKA